MDDSSTRVRHRTSGAVTDMNSKKREREKETKEFGKRGYLTPGKIK
jgi:hypothetical protein